MITSKDFKRKLTISGGQKKTKACLNLELITGKEIYIQRRGEVSLLTNILCRNCVDKNETIVRKILEVRESFVSSRAIDPKKTCTGEETCKNKRALFVACDDPLRPAALYTMNLSNEEAF